MLIIAWAMSSQNLNLHQFEKRPLLQMEIYQKLGRFHEKEGIKLIMNPNFDLNWSKFVAMRGYQPQGLDPEWGN